MISVDSKGEKTKYTTANYKELEKQAKEQKKAEQQKRSPGSEKGKTKYTTANYKQLDAAAKEKRLHQSAIVETNEKILKNLEKTGTSLMKSIEKTGSLLLMRKSKSSTAFGNSSEAREDEPTLV